MRAYRLLARAPSRRARHIMRLRYPTPARLSAVATVTAAASTGAALWWLERSSHAAEATLAEHNMLVSEEPVENEALFVDPKPLNPAPGTSSVLAALETSDTGVSVSDSGDDVAPDLTVWSAMSPDWYLWLAATAGVIGGVVIGAQLPITVGHLLDAMSQRPSETDPGQAPALLRRLVGLVVAQATLVWASQRALWAASERFVSRVKKALYSALVRADMAFWDTSQSRGVHASLVEGDVYAVRTALRHAITGGVTGLSGLVLGMTSMWMLSPQLTGVLGLAVPIIVGFGYAWGQSLRSQSAVVSACREAAAARAEDTLSNVQSVKAYGAEPHEEDRYAIACEQVHEASTALGSGISMFAAVSTVAIQGLAAIVFGWNLVSPNVLTGGQMTSFMVTTLGMQKSLSSIALCYNKWITGMASSDRIERFLQEHNTQQPHRGSGNLQLTGQVGGRWQLDGVHFHYPTRPNAPVLSNVSITLEPGQTVALVGPSGSGKSTIAKLLLGFYSAQGGDVTLDAIPLPSLDPTWLRSQIAVVPQQLSLFSGSVRDNIRYGCFDATQEDVERAAEKAHALEFITRLPNGFDTEVGPSGSQLSGGQVQRIAIARAILRDPRLLILDEATASLDSQSEAMVADALKHLMMDRTCLVIAHRLSTVRHADVIVVVEGGRIIQVGSHSVLMRDEAGLYRRLVATQLAQ